MMSRYTSLGVSCQKEDVYTAIRSVDKGLFPSAFCKVIPDLLCGDNDYCLVMHADGAGTKTSIAYMYWKETGDLSVFEGIAQDSLVMNTDDLLCVGAADRFIVSSNIGRNSKLINGEVLRELIESNERLVGRFADMGLTLFTAGGETADLGDVVRTLIVDCTVITRLPRSEVISNSKIVPGLLIYGLSSFGKVKYESKYNSGIGSNGLTMAKHELLDSYYEREYGETYEPTLDAGLKYAGKYRLEQQLEGTNITIGEALLSPTRTYAPIIKQLLNTHREHVASIVHCSGGGQTKCLKFGKGLHYIKDNVFEPPPLFKLIWQESKSTWRDMYQVFNMGHRMEIYGPECLGKALCHICSQYELDWKVVGRIEGVTDPEGRNELTIHVKGPRPGGDPVEVLHYVST